MRQAFYERNEKNRERADKIVAAIQEYGELITGKEIKELVGDKSSVSAFKAFMSHYVAPNYPEIEAIPRKGYIYREINKEEKSDNALYKNSEGYLDPTAGKALANLMMSSKVTETNLIPGEVWVKGTGSYKGVKDELALIIGESRSVINYIPVRDFAADKDYYYDDYCISFMDSGKKYFIDWRQLRTGGQNPFDRYKFLLDDGIFQEIKNNIASRLGIGTEIKEVKVEVPAKLTIRDCVDFLTKSGWMNAHDKEIVEYNLAGLILSDDGGQDTTIEDLKAYKTKAEIWETAFRLMCGKEQ